jgi:hypothetical protein
MQHKILHKFYTSVARSPWCFLKFLFLSNHALRTKTVSTLICFVIKSPKPSLGVDCTYKETVHLQDSWKEGLQKGQSPH